MHRAVEKVKRKRNWIREEPFQLEPSRLFFRNHFARSLRGIFYPSLSRVPSKEVFLLPSPAHRFANRSVLVAKQVRPFFSRLCYFRGREISKDTHFFFPLKNSARLEVTDRSSNAKGYRYGYVFLGRRGIKR